MSEIEGIVEDPFPHDSLSELARQRREDVARDSKRPKPEFLRSVEQSEVVYTFDLQAMPFRQLDLTRLSAQLAELYGVQIDGPDLSPLLSVMTREQLVTADEEVLLQKLVRLPNPGWVKWTDGRFPLRDDFIPIRAISINYESIQISVAGESEVAEVIAQETMELIWRLAGSKKSFERDLKPFILLTSYGTRTRLQLDFGPEVLLNPSLINYLEDNLAKGKGFANLMGRQKNSSRQGLDEVNAIAGVDSITIRVNSFNPQTGYSDECDIDFDVTGRSDYRTGRIAVTSQLPYESHIELISGIFGAINPDA